MVCNSGDATQFGDPPDPNVYQPIVLQPRETPAMFAVADKVVTNPQPRAAFIGLASAAIQALQDNQKAEAAREAGRSPGTRSSRSRRPTSTRRSRRSRRQAGRRVRQPRRRDVDPAVRGLRAAGITAPVIGSDSSTTVASETTKDEHYYVVEALSPGGTPGGGYQKFLDAGRRRGSTREAVRDPRLPAGHDHRGRAQGLQRLLRAEADRLARTAHLDTDGLTAGPVTTPRPTTSASRRCTRSATTRRRARRSCSPPTSPPGCDWDH